MNNLQKARKFAQKVVKKYNLSPPIDPKYVIDKEGISLVKEENQLGIDAYTNLEVPVTIKLNTEITFEPRIRFTLAHELGHYFIPWHTGNTIYSADNSYIRISGKKYLDTQELEANIFASEFLIPTDWLRNVIKDNNYGCFKELVEKVQKFSYTSIMATLYALENALPSGYIYFVKKNTNDYWKLFKSANTYNTKIYYQDETKFLQKVSLMHEYFQISYYEIDFFKLLPCPEPKIINSLYEKCNCNIEMLLNAITNYKPILALPFLSTILNYINDKYYFVIKIDNTVQHFSSKDCVIHIGSGEDYYNFDKIYKIVSKYYKEYGQIILDSKSTLLWVKEKRFLEKKYKTINANKLLKTITNEIYPESISHKMLQRINGVISSANNDSYSREELYNIIVHRFIGKEEYEKHPMFHNYISNKISCFLRNREIRQQKN